MASQNPEMFSGVIAGGDLRDKQFYGAKLSADRTVVIATAGAVFGVIQNNGANIGDHVSLANEGLCKVKLGGTVAAGDQITTDSAGKFVKLTTSIASGGQYQISMGTMIEAGVANDVATAQLHPPVPVHTA